MKIIDIHVHAFEHKGFPRDGITPTKRFALPEELISLYDKYSIDMGCVLPLVSPEGRYSTQSTEEVLYLCKKYSDRLIPWCNVDPRQLTNDKDAPLHTILMYYEDLGCKGIGEITANLPFNHPLVENLLKGVEMVGFPLIFHMAPKIGGTYGLYDDIGMSLLENALKKYPDLIFLGHSQAFWAEIGPVKNNEERMGYPKGKIKKPGRVVELMRKYENLHGDLSAHSGFNALARDEDFAAEFIEEFADRLYFGTDICSPDGEAPLLEFLFKLEKKGKISSENLNKILFYNAKKLLNL